MEDLGYEVEMTPASNDYGVDLLLEDPETSKKIAVQAKFYNHSSLGNTPVQEVIAGLAFYGADEGWVITNGSFSANAVKLADANNVRLIDNSELNHLISVAQSNPSDNYAPGAEPDLTGFDVILDIATPEKATHINGNPREQNGNGAKSNSPDNAPSSPIEATFNKNDVKIRWGCSNGAVEKQISQGMPMKKLPNGRWSISEHDLIEWEKLMIQRAEQKKKADRRNTIIISVLTAVLFIVVIIIFWGPLIKYFVR